MDRSSNAVSPQENAGKSKELRRLALRWLAESDPAAKVKGVRGLHEECCAGLIALETEAGLGCSSGLVLPGRPGRPELVPPLQVEKRSMHTLEGRAALVHALAHIEFNAINLALDAVWRFAEMPEDYYADWLRVASEEARHFELLSGHLASLGYGYGDFPAHNSLWDMAEATADDALARMALVPRTLEARGLDASPAVRAKLAQAGDEAAAAIVDIILRDEIGHVAVGNRWFFWLCARRGRHPVETFDELCTRYRAPVMRGPFNLEARRAAGFTEEELNLLLSRAAASRGEGANRA